MLHHSSPDNQPKFDMIESAGIGYHYLFNERAYLIKLIAAPFFIKLVTLLLLFAFDLTGNPLALNIALLPSFFAEGWLYAQVTRSFLFNERWPIALSGEKERDALKLNNRQTCILASIIVFVLIHIAAYAVQSLMHFTEQDLQNFALISVGETLPEGANISYTPIITMIVLLFSAIFWFPLLLIYIAPAANMYMTDFYMTAIKQRLVFKMVACYIICAIPFFAALSLVTNFLVTAFSINVQDVSAAEQILIGVIAEFTYLLIGITVTVATAAGMRSFFGKPIPKNIEKE